VFLPMTLAIVAGSMIASRITIRIGAKRLLIFGMSMLTVGLALFSTITVHSSYFGIIIVASLLTSFAMPFAFIPGTITATSGVAPQEAGIASGIVNAARLFGGALGLAILATLATSHSNSLLRHPTASVHNVHQALVSGYDLAFLVGACMAFVGVLVAGFVIPNVARRPAAAAVGPVAPAIEV
jgi:MFS family permease